MRRGLIRRWSCQATAATLSVATVAAVAPGGPAREAPGAETPAGPVWAVDPDAPGPDLPPVGRSLFDFFAHRRDRPGPAAEIPFPFAELLRRIEAEAGGPGPSPLRRVLLPLGRSLQRNAGAPDFFRYPRAVAAVDREAGAASGPPSFWLKDRLFLGYHERAGVLEVISYNEAAGRFEFQLVHDYRPGGRPELVYANRAVCTVCHQGQAPVFARGLWDETQANPEVAARLAAEGRDFYGFPLAQGVDVPYFLDAATDRANRFAATQLLWREGCGAGAEAVACRATALLAALQVGLGGGRAFDPDGRFARTLAPAVARAWAERWPGGLLLPDPDLPNRDPLRRSGADVRLLSLPDGLDRRERDLFHDLVLSSHVPAHFEPLNPRPALETWTAAMGAERLVAGLADFLAAGDFTRLDEALFARGSVPGAPRERFAAPCDVSPRRASGDAIDRVKFRCRGDGSSHGLDLDGRVFLADDRVTGGKVDRLVLGGGGEPLDLVVTGGRLSPGETGGSLAFTVAQPSSGLHARGPGGDAVERIEIGWEIAAESPAATPTFPGEAHASRLGDFTLLEAAVDRIVTASAAGALASTASAYPASSLPLSDAPFRRTAVLAALFAELELPGPPACCLDASWMPPPRRDAPAEAQDELQLADAPDLAPFVRYCGECHRTREPAPPNFLAGPPDRIRATLAHCGERILVRLAMGQTGEPDRAKTPMPPASALARHGLTPAAWGGHPDLQLLRATADRLLAARLGKPPRLDDLLARGYDRLRPCLPGSS